MLWPGQEPRAGQGEPFVAEAGKPLLVSFLCNHCPKTVPLRPATSVLFEEFGEAVSFVAVMSNDLLYCPMDGPEDMAKEQKEFGWNLPYLMDEDQSVAKAFSASLTPEFFIYDASHKLVFHGAAGADGIALKAACEALLAGSEVTELWTDSQRALCSTY